MFQLWYHPKLKIILKFEGGLILKRWIVALLCGLLVLGLTACGQSAEQEDDGKLHIVATYDLLFNTSVMVREGLGYVLGFAGLVYTGADSDLCFRPLDPTLTSPMYIVWRKYQVFSPVAGLLLEKLNKAFG